MSQHHLAKGQRIIMGEREYTIEQRLPKGLLQLKDAATNICLTRSDNDMIELLFRGHLKLVGNEQAEKYTEKKMSSILVADLTEFTDKQREEVRKKHMYVTNLIAMGVDRKTKKVFEPLIEAIARANGDEDPPSYWKVYRWYTHFIKSGESSRAFFPLDSEKGTEKDTDNRKIQREVCEIIDESIGSLFLTEQKLTVRAVYSAVIARIDHENDLRTKAGNIEKLLIPSEKTIHNVIGKLDPYEVAKARYGQRFADLKFKPKQEGARPKRPLERVELDHTKLDLLVVDLVRRMPIGRPWITVAIDVYSKCIVGIYIGFVPPSYHSVMQCLKHGMSPKTYIKERFPNIKHTWDTYGIMETVVVDNGKEFHSADLEDACLQLGMVILYAPVKCSWYKPSIERFFGTLNTSLLHPQPGTTFSNIFEKGEYDPKKNAVISFQTFEEMVHKWIVDIYHQDKHKGHNGQPFIPAIVWKTGIDEFPPALPSSAADLNVMLGMVETRTITDSGIELFNLFYNNDNLMSIRRKYKMGTKIIVKIKYDPSDLSMIYVQDEFKKTYYPVEAVSQTYTQGLNLWAHRVICRYAREQLKLDLDITALACAKAEIWELASAEWNLTKRTGSRSKLARLFNVGQDDYGQIIEQEPDTSDNDAALPEQPASCSDIVIPLPADHPANGISRIVAPANSTEGEASGDENSDIGKGDFITDQPKKKGRPKSKKQDNGNGDKTAEDQQKKAAIAILVDEEEPDLSGWGISHMNKE